MNTTDNKGIEATLYFDGGIRNGVCAYGWLLVNPEDETEVIASGHRTCGSGTSNLAEYRSLIAGLQGSLKAGVNVVHIIGDSRLVVSQVGGYWKVNKPELIKHRDRALELLKQFEDYTIKWVPRKENKRADALVNEVFEKRSGKCSKQKRKRKRS
jgi:probable phosphoglycerate mutase